MQNSVIETYLSGSPALDPVFVNLRQEIFGRSRDWIELALSSEKAAQPSRALFDRSKQKLGGIPATVLGPALGWELRPWILSSSGSDSRDLLTALNARGDWDACQINCLSPQETETIKAQAHALGNGVLEFPFRVSVISGMKNYADYLEKRGSGSSKNLRRSLRKALDAGFEFREQMTWEDIEKVLDARAREFSNGSDYTKTQEFRTFLKAFREQMIAQNRWTEVGMYHGSRPISYDLGFWNGRVFHCYQTAYDPEYRDYRPGALNLDRSIEVVLNRGCDIIDLMGDSDYFKLFTKEVLELKRVMVFSRRLKGRLLSTMFTIRVKRSGAN